MKSRIFQYGLMSSVLITGGMDGIGGTSFRSLIRYDRNDVEAHINFGCRNNLRRYVLRCGKEGVTAGAFREQVAKWRSEGSSAEALTAACNALQLQIASTHADGFDFSVHTSYPELTYSDLVSLCGSAQGKGAITADDTGAGLVGKVGTLEDIKTKFATAYSDAADNSNNPHKAAFDAAVNAQFPGGGGGGGDDLVETSISLGDEETTFRSAKALSALQKSLVKSVYDGCTACGYTPAAVRNALATNAHLLTIGSEDEFKLYGIMLANHAEPTIELSEKMLDLGELFRYERNNKYGYVPISLIKITEYYQGLTAAEGDSAVNIAAAAFIAGCKSFLAGEISLLEFAETYNSYGAAIRTLGKALTEGADAAALGLSAYSAAAEATYTQAKTKNITSLFCHGRGEGVNMFFVDPNAWDAEDVDD
jgi:hypothetical protein